ncbi:hypothetical protein EPUS_06439 [Endocarpon pusillum Z07020]|uniref:Thioredoxin n=1 Tax=Endocarpon pusillum (strain Z07020 / HMAS-L-300199) TaxID=1263415 RepID=U1HGT0_ENDPU|nr:uncharacterized protein EPUS_06439 [Endocarpon pusillum Z07020]ERF68049.1 hypothetical protein EPUS_06439 [Endocarpon pusillum Z07020]
MSKTVHIESTAQFSSLIASSKIVVADFHATWCGPCKQIAPMYEQLSAQLSRPQKITFTKIDVDQQQELAGSYGVTAMPTFMIFKNGRSIQTIRGADPKQLSAAVKKLANEAEAAGDAGNGGFAESSGDSFWVASEPAKGYTNVTDQVDIKGLELLNFDGEFGNVRTLFDSTRPKALDGGKPSTKDWVESDTDDQLMLFVPFQSTLKIHTLQITSVQSNGEDEEAPMRPKTVQIYTNRSHILGFEEADDITPTQSITLQARDWDPKTGTAKIELRFVKFQNVSSLVIFVVNGDGEGEKVRLDRIRIIGESGEKRDPGKLEKIGDDHD